MVSFSSWHLLSARGEVRPVYKNKRIKTKTKISLAGKFLFSPNQCHMAITGDYVVYKNNRSNIMRNV